MRLLTTLAACLVAFPVSAKTWDSTTSDGILMATVTNEADEIAVICDVGINAPVTSINFIVAGVSPAPLSNVALFFDKDKPIYVATDEEGAIGSVTSQEAVKFDEVLALIKSKSKLKVRLFNGATQTFRLSGSSKAVSECRADYSTFELALN